MLRTMHLFAGAGGGLLADLILGHEPVCAVEWDAYACQVLRERAADGWFPGLHVHEGDVRLFDPSDWAGRVDCIHAGFPCQDISSAGRGAGVGEGTRSGLYREVLRIADVVRPRFLYLENVAAILNRGLDTVLGDLAARGYNCRWTCVRAADVGAPHQRDRWWCLATHADRYGQHDGAVDAEVGEPSESVAHAMRSGPIGANRESGGMDGAKRSEEERKPEVEGSAAESAFGSYMADSPRFQQGRQEQRAERQRAEAGGQSVAVDDANSAQREGRRVSSGIRAEHSDTSGAGWWQLESDVGRVADGVAARVDRLKALGNGQVPLQAALGWIMCGGPVT